MRSEPKGRKERIMIGSRKKRSCACLLACLVWTMMTAGGCGRAGQAQDSEIGEEISAEAEVNEKGGAALTETADDEKGEEDVTAQTEDSSIIFTAQDLEGNTVTEEVFAEAKLTMVNVWATYCNPCLSEMPGLGELAGEYEKDVFRIIGIVSDVQEGAETDAVEYAASLVAWTGADYPHLLLNESLFRSMLSGVNAVPTTFFVNEKGEVLDTVVGAMDRDAWKEKIDGFLDE